MKRVFFGLALLVIFVTGCGSSGRTEIEKFIQDAFKARSDAVFLYKDKKPLSRYFTTQALEQSRAYLSWSPKNQWNNVKDLKYSNTLRIENVRIDGKQAEAVVYETVVVTWDYINPALVTGTAFVKEDAWANKKHRVVLTLTAEGNWMIDQDIVEQ